MTAEVFQSYTVEGLRMRQRAKALVSASVAFLARWELEGGTDVGEARKALQAVFQFDSPLVLERAITRWQRDSAKAA